MTTLRHALLIVASILAIVISPTQVASAEDDGGQTPSPPTVTTGSDDTVPGFETGATDEGEDGKSTPGKKPPAPSPGTWKKTGYACEIGGAATCHESKFCSDGSVKTTWVKTHEGMTVDEGEFCPGEEPTNTPPIDPREELKKVLLPEAVIAVQPPEGETLVNLPTIFSTAALTYTAPPLDVLGQKVVFTLTPTTFVWHHGDGTKQTTDTAGKKYEDGDEPTALINHLYLETATDLAVSVDITWSATWALNGEDQGPVDSTVTKVGAAQELDVLEARPTLVN